jgi:hypothetical protein
MPIPLAIAGAAGVLKSGNLNLPGGFHISFAHNANKGRVESAQRAYVAAMNGDQRALDEINTQRFGSATRVGQEAYQSAWDSLLAAGRITAAGIFAQTDATKDGLQVPQRSAALGGVGLSTMQVLLVVGGIVGGFVLLGFITRR